MSALPIVFHLMEQGKSVYLAFSGSAFGPNSRKVAPHCIQVDPDSTSTYQYTGEVLYRVA